MLWEKVPVTTFYLKNKDVIDREQAVNPRKTLIRELDPAVHYKDGNTNILKILKQMFELNMFSPITSNDQNIIQTCEYNCKLDDYTNLDYDAKLCTQKITKKCFNQKWSQIYYADFESDVTVNPHRAYLCCIAYQKDDKSFLKSITGTHIANELLEFLQHESLTYFHNLKYDACFFVNKADDYEVNVLQRTGTVIQVVLTHRVTEEETDVS
jgi:hypothetical protein